MLCNTESERKQVISQFTMEEALKIRLDKSTIDEYRPKLCYLSEGDKYERSEQMGDPIRREFLFDDRLAPFGEPDMMVDYVYHSGDLNNGLLRESGDQSADDEEEEE